MKHPGGESKGVMTYTMGVGDLWLLSSFEGEFGGQKFSGKGFDSFYQHKKKYVGIWVDNMVTAPLVMEGSFDAAKKAMTMTGESTGPDGKPIEVSIAQSSGHRLLDEAARDAIAGCAFVPQKVGGRAVKAIVEIPIPFKLI